MKTFKLASFVLTACLVFSSLEPVMAAIMVSKAKLDAQCKRQYGDNAVAKKAESADAKSWRCYGVGNPPKGISVENLCNHFYGKDYRAKTQDSHWVCER